MVNRNMGLRTQIYKILLPVIMVVTGSVAEAATLPDSQHFIGRYDFTWTGIKLAAMELSITQDKEKYALHLAIQSAGIVNLFTHHISDTVAHGRRDGNQYFPELYESHYWTKKKPRHLKIVFDAKGAVKEDMVEPPEDPTERPTIPHSLKDGTVDPLTMLLVAAAGNYKPRVFDAKHLFDGTATKGEQKVIRTYNGPRNAIPFALTRKPVAGMTKRELKEYEEGDPPLTFYFTADNTGIPLYITMPLAVGLIKGSLTKECETWDECKVL